MKKKDKKSPQAKVGVYICYCGGNISDHVDVEKVRKRIAKHPNVTVARTNMFMCSDPGQEMIIEDLKSGKVNRVVVASCAPSLHETTFKGAIQRAGANPYLYEHANIREQVSWVHHGKDATDKATKLVAAAVAKAALLEPLTPIRVDTKDHITVVGGGIAGLKSARDLALRGFKVTLIEKSPYLGGNVAKLVNLAPTNIKTKELLCSIAAEVLSNPNIEVMTCSSLVDFSGYIGNFRIKIKQKLQMPQDTHPVKEPIGEKGFFIPFKGILPLDGCKNAEKEILTGAIVLATGFRPYTPKDGEYGFKKYKEVITTLDFIEQLETTSVNSDGYLKLNGKRIRSLVLIHCVGSRQIPGIHEEDENGRLNEYCSRVCCTTLLNLANIVKSRFPSTQVFELYRDIRTYGRYQEELYKRGSENRVKFIRFVPEDQPEVLGGNGEFPVFIKVKDTLTYDEEFLIPADLVILGVGMVPSDIDDIIKLLKVPLDNDGFLQEVHPKLRPVETSVDGIVIAGTSQAPMDTSEVSNSASCAAAKVTSLLGKGYVEIDPFVAEVDPKRCKGHKACIDACLKDGAIVFEKGKAKVIPALCFGCGACVPACPEGAINLKGSTLEQYEKMVDMIVNDELIAD